MPVPTDSSPTTTGPEHAVPNLYRSLHSAGRQAMDELAANETTRGQLVGVHASVLDFEPWLSVLVGRLEQHPLQTAVRELHAATLMASQALYRPAYMALRLFLELSLGAVYYSALELELRRWTAGARDVIWSEVSDKGSGVLSAAFAKAYAPQLEDSAEVVRILARTVYRTCSQFVHGNPGPTSLIPSDIVFSESTFSTFCERTDDAVRVVLFAMTVRYASSLEADELELVKPGLIDRLGNVDAVRALLAPLPE